MIQPEGYKIVPTMCGFEKSFYETISVVDLFGSSYDGPGNYKNFVDFCAEEKRQIFKLFDTLICGYPARVGMTDSEFPGYNSIWIYFGDTTFSALVVSRYESNNLVLEQHLLEIFLSIKCDKTQPYNPLENLPFEADTISTRFKFSEYYANTWFFTQNGKKMDSLNPIVFIMAFSDFNVSIAKVSLDIYSEARYHGYIGYMDEYSKTEVINGQRLLTTYGKCFSLAKQKFFYQRSLLINGVVLTTIGFVDATDEEGIIELKKFMELIKIKNYE